MVAKTDCAEKSKPIAGNKVCGITSTGTGFNCRKLNTRKLLNCVMCNVNYARFLLQVSKPLMEKKRRARINKCLDQLKSLLESYYSTSVSIFNFRVQSL